MSQFQKRYRLRVLGWLVFMVALIATVAYLFPWGSDAETAYGRIQEGMTFQQVQDTLGRPPGNYCTDPSIAFWGGSILAKPSHHQSVDWAYNDGIIWIYLDSAGVVVGKGFGRPASKNWFEQMLYSSGLRKTAF